MTKTQRAEKRYDHYYVEPGLRYKQRESDPKLQRDNLAHPEYLYRKLHDEKFNHWQHPFEK